MNDMGKGGLVGGQTMNATVRYLNPIWLTVFPSYYK